MRRILILLLSLGCLNSYAFSIPVKERLPTKRERQTVANAMAQLRGQYALDESTLEIKAWREIYLGHEAWTVAEVYALPVWANGICKAKWFQIHIDKPSTFRLSTEGYRGWLSSTSDCKYPPLQPPKFYDDLADEDVRSVYLQRDILKRYGKAMALRAGTCPVSLTGCDLTLIAASQSTRSRTAQKAVSLTFSFHPLTTGSQCDSSTTVSVIFEQLGEKFVPIDAFCPFD